MAPVTNRGTYVRTYVRNCPALVPPRVASREKDQGGGGGGPKPVEKGEDLPRSKPSGARGAEERGQIRRCPIPYKPFSGAVLGGTAVCARKRACVRAFAHARV